MGVAGQWVQVHYYYHHTLDLLRARTVTDTIFGSKCNLNRKFFGRLKRELPTRGGGGAEIKCMDINLKGFLRPKNIILCAMIAISSPTGFLPEPECPEMDS